MVIAMSLIIKLNKLLQLAVLVIFLNLRVCSSDKNNHATTRKRSARMDYKNIFVHSTNHKL